MSLQPEIVKVLRLLVGKANWTDEAEQTLAEDLLATLDESTPAPSPAPASAESPVPSSGAETTDGAPQATDTPAAPAPSPTAQ